MGTHSVIACLMSKAWDCHEKSNCQREAKGGWTKSHTVVIAVVMWESYQF